MNKRKLPVWMIKPQETRKVLSEKQLLNVQYNSNKPNEQETTIDIIQKPDVVVYNLNNDKKIVVEHSSPPSALNSSTEDSINFPPIKYKGKIEFFTDMREIAFSCDSLMQWVEKQEASRVPIAFDMEWPFNFISGAGKTSLIQVCADVNICILYHVFNLKKLPAALIALLAHKKVILHGVNIKNDIRKLERDFPEVGVANAQAMIDQCIDLGVWYNEIYLSSGRWSLERLVHRLCKLQINKDKSIRMSKWNSLPLNHSQKLYAAIDVYIGQVIYEIIKHKVDEKEEEENILKFLENELFRELNKSD